VIGKEGEIVRAISGPGSLVQAILRI